MHAPSDPKGPQSTPSQSYTFISYTPTLRPSKERGGSLQGHPNGAGPELLPGSFYLTPPPDPGGISGSPREQSGLEWHMDPKSQN
jgi:hypothetical protein